MRPEDVQCEFLNDKGGRETPIFVLGDDIPNPGGFPLRGAWYCEDCEMVFPGAGKMACPYCQSSIIQPLTRSVMPLSAIKTV